jgi:hypothetical protein
MKPQMEWSDTYLTCLYPHYNNQSLPHPQIFQPNSSVHVTTTEGGVLATPTPQSADNLFEFGLQPAGHARWLCVSISVLEARNQDVMLTGSL